MAQDPFKVAIMLRSQAVLGTINPTLDAFNIAGASALLSDGLVLGDSESGEGGSGIDFASTRRLREKAIIAGSFTRPGSDFLSEEFTMDVAWPFSGDRRDTTMTTPLDSDFRHDLGIEGILRACGLQREPWVAGVGDRYFPGNIDGTAASWASARLLYEGSDYHLRDLLGDLVLTFAPGDVAIAKASLVGQIDSHVAAVFPVNTPDYGVQASVAAPVVQNVGHLFGHSDTGGAADVLRPFSSLELTIANEVEEVPDSNAATGISKLQTGRTITAKATIIQDSNDSDYFRSKLIKTISGTDRLFFRVGTPQTLATPLPALAYQVTLTNPEVRDLTPKKIGDRQGWEVSLAVLDETANGEMQIIFE